MNPRYLYQVYKILFPCLNGGRCEVLEWIAGVLAGIGPHVLPAGLGYVMEFSALNGSVGSSRRSKPAEIRTTSVLLYGIWRRISDMICSFDSLKLKIMCEKSTCLTIRSMKYVQRKKMPWLYLSIFQGFSWVVTTGLYIMGLLPDA